MTQTYPAGELPNRGLIVCNHGRVRRWLVPLLAVVSMGLGAVAAPAGRADYTPWFAPKVGNATQVISVVGAGGSSAKIDVFQRTAAGWQPIRTGIPGIRRLERHGPGDP